MNNATRATLIEMYEQKLASYRRSDPAVHERNSAMMQTLGYGPLAPLASVIAELERKIAALQVAS